MSRLGFRVEGRATGSQARAGHFRTLHNDVKTPVFMPVGTQATVKGLSASQLEGLGAQVLLANTYHLLLRPGPEVFEAAGGIQKFMGWPRSVLTDSGGFQIFSLPDARNMREDGAMFRSYVDQREILLSPERSIAMQRSIGSDIMMVLDQCVPATCDRETALDALELTHRWAKRSLVARGESPQSLFGIVQGACYEDLRKRSAEQITALPFDGFAIGGLAVGESRQEREDFCELTAGLLPADRPRYLMGVGTPIDLLEAVHRGVDMFDCIIPTMMAQQGSAYTARGVVRLRKTSYRLDQGPIEEGCACEACRSHSRSYLHHLFKAGEGLAWRLICIHNIHFYLRFMERMREAILADRFLELYRSVREEIVLLDGEEKGRATTPRAPRERKSALERGDFRVALEADGMAKIVRLSSGEAVPAAGEHHELEGLLSQEGPPLVVWDRGLGAGHGAMATLNLAERLTSEGRMRRNLRLISFGTDLDAFRLALAHPKHFPHLRHSAPYALVRDGAWQGPSRLDDEPAIRWELFEGEMEAFADEAPPAHVVLSLDAAR